MSRRRGPNPPGPLVVLALGIPRTGWRRWPRAEPPGPVGGVGRGPNPPGPVGGVGGRRNGVGLLR